MESFAERQDFIKIREPESDSDDVPLDPNLIVDAVYDWETDLPPTDEIKKQHRYIYMRDVYSNINKRKIDNLRKLSNKQYDDIDLSKPFELEEFLCQAEPLEEKQARQILNQKQD